MTRDQIRTTVVSALAGVAPELDANALDPKADLRDTLDLDSIDYLNFIVALHKATGVSVPEKEYRQLSTLDSCIDYIAAHMQAA